jgi:hypothetical protein
VTTSLKNSSTWRRTAGASSISSCSSHGAETPRSALRFRPW